MWEMNQPWWEMVLRAIIIYFAVFALLRLIGKKQIGESSPFDLVLLLIISEAVSNGLMGEEHSISGAIILAVTLVSLNWFVDLLAFKFKKVETLVEGQACILISNGQVNEKMRINQKITQSELESSLREHGISDFSEVYLGVLEANGKISIVPQKTPPRGTSAPNDRLIT